MNLILEPYNEFLDKKGLSWLRSDSRRVSPSKGEKSDSLLVWLQSFKRRSSREVEVGGAGGWKEKALDEGGGVCSASLLCWICLR